MKNVTLPYGFTPREYQEPLWSALFSGDYKRGAVVLPRRNGKDLVFWNACIAKAFQRVGLHFYIAPFYNQVRQIIWEGADKEGRRFLDYIPRELIARKTQLDMKIELVNGSIIKLLGSDMIDRVVGTNPIVIWFTEFSLHKPEVWHYLRPILAENGGEAWFNGTPRGLNHFYKLYETATRDSLWYTLHLSRDDTGIPSLQAIEEDRRSGMPESLVQQEYYVKWTASSEEVLIPLDIIEPCQYTVLKQEDYDFQPRIMGVDVAYAVKGDQAAIAKRQGRFLRPIRKFRGLNNMALATEVANEIKSWKPDAVFVDAGRGEGVIHRLWQLGFTEEVIPVHFSGKSFSELYFNKRAEIWCKMRDWFLQEKRPLIPADQQLMSDMSAFTFFINDKGFIQLEGKKEAKRRLKRSPDEGDSVALTFAEEIEAEQYESAEDKQLKQLIHNIKADYAESNYDVLNYFNRDDYDLYSDAHGDR